MTMLCNSLLNANSELICATCNKCMFDGIPDMCLLDFVKNVNGRAKSAKKHKKQKIWKPTGHVFTEVGLKWKPIGRTFTIVGNSCPLTRITSANVVHPKKTTSHSVETQKPELKVYSRRPKHIKNVGYGDYQLGNVTISRVYYVEGLGHNLFSIGQFCDPDLEVSFQKSTCFIRNLEGVDLLSGSSDTNLYTISLDDMPKSKQLRAGYGTIGYRISTSEKARNPLINPKPKNQSKQKLYLLHMDLCGPMRVASINGKRTKDEAPEAIIKCIKNIQVRLNATVRNVITDNGTEFVNQTLREFYENVGISHQTSVACTP
ncbi:retrovirus-related pol polyprotein from transposon TNT 1-94 [Tanacetum coccineum]|uniref:Retrovirus-related pol polyprotein from transposon TNT 1-94 n=1 Tax=Tanacetum coccineum TaxID=301880 RepID=A0ABQ5J1R0_9ASTR